MSTFATSDCDYQVRAVASTSSAKLGAKGFEEAEGSSAVVAEPQSQSIPTNQDCACISSHCQVRIQFSSALFLAQINYFEGLSLIVLKTALGTVTCIAVRIIL
jgi:hypothetical protein